MAGMTPSFGHFPDLVLGNHFKGPLQVEQVTNVVEANQHSIMQAAIPTCFAARLVLSQDIRLGREAGGRSLACSANPVPSF